MMLAAARKSPMRELVHEPMKTTFTGCPAIGAPALSPMYSSAFASAARSAGLPADSGLGTRPVTGMPIPGFVPYVTIGARALASSDTEASNAAPRSVLSSRHFATAASHASPCGAKRRPFSHAKVFSSGAIMPARAPPSIDMLHTVMRSSMSSASMAGPRYSMTCPVARRADLRDEREDNVLRTHARRQVPSTRTSSVFGLRCKRHWVASTCSTSLVPMPNASAPNAPCVEVWLSPQTIVRPGCVRPSSGPMTWTMPRSGSLCRAALCRIRPRSSPSRAPGCGGLHLDRHGSVHRGTRASASSGPSLRACGPGAAPSAHAPSAR